MLLAHKPAHWDIGTTNGNKNKLPQLMQWRQKGTAEVQHHSPLTSALRQTYVINFTLWSLYSPRKSSSTHCREGWYRWAWRTENPFPPPAFEHWTAQPLASHYINSRFLQSTKVQVLLLASWWWRQQVLQKYIGTLIICYGHETH